MGRLKQLPPMLRQLPPRLPTFGVTAENDRTRHRDASQPWRRWYKTARWQKLRWLVLVRDLFTCRMCGRIEGATRLLVADHIAPHRGDARLFWDEANLQCLCKACHDGSKQSMDKLSAAGNQRVRAQARPTWLKPSRVPVTLVAGPPGAGKSSWVRRHAGSGDMVICWDEIATRLFGRTGPDRPNAHLSEQERLLILRERNRMLASLADRSASDRIGAAWFILSEPDGSHREWWHRQIGAQIVVLATPAEECRRRISEDDAAGDRRGEATRTYVDRWWAAYTEAACDRVVTE